MPLLRRINGLKRAGALMLACGLATGCATGRGTIDLKSTYSVNPSTGPDVKLVRVSDRRVFQIDPPQPSTPSLMDGQINNSAITSRAIARKRGGFGQAMGDIVLPQGRTVEQVVSEVLSRGLRGSGYRVLEEGEPKYDDAVPLEVDIHQFWAWFTPGFWAITLEFDSRIRVSGPIQPFDDGEEFRGYASTQSGAAFTEDWLNIMKMGLASLNEDITSRQLLRATFVPRNATPITAYAKAVLPMLSDGGVETLGVGTQRQHHVTMNPLRLGRARNEWSD